MRRWGVALLAAALAGGCGSDGDDGSAVRRVDTGCEPRTVVQRAPLPPGEQGPLTFDRFMIKADGKLTVGADLERPPMTFVGEDGAPTGFEVELVAEIAKRMGLVADVQHRPRDELLTALAQGTYDVVVAELPIPAQPPDGLVFSDPYLDGEVAVVMGDEPARPQVVGAAGGVEIECPGAQLRHVEDVDAALTMLSGGELDAIAADFVAAAHALETGEHDDVAVVDRIATGEHYGIPSATITPPVGKAVNTALADIREDGTYAEIFEHWFGQSA